MYSVQCTLLSVQCAVQRAVFWSDLSAIVANPASEYNDVRQQRSDGSTKQCNVVQGGAVVSVAVQWPGN